MFWAMTLDGEAEQGDPEPEHGFIWLQKPDMWCAYNLWSWGYLEGENPEYGSTEIEQMTADDLVV